MATLESLRRRIESTEDLQSVVKTMKALAAVNIRHYENAVAALADYSRSVDLALQAALRDRPRMGIRAKVSPMNRVGALVFGSDQGMCGQLNDEISRHAESVIASKLGVKRSDTFLTAVGVRVASRLEEQGWRVAKRLPVPTSISGITTAVQDMLAGIEHWNAAEGIAHVFLFYNEQQSGAAYRPRDLHLLPVDQAWLERLRRQPWPTRRVPMFTLEWDALFSALIRQYVFISLYRATAESLASENASRLASMQGAERNIEEMLSELYADFHQQRQMGITEELLDIVSGFEALKENDD